MGGDKCCANVAGLPNVTGNLNAGNGRIGSHASGSNAKLTGIGAFVTGSTRDVGGSEWGGYYTSVSDLSFDASRCSIIYGNSETVMPLSFMLIPQIKI